jgi:hypothetical protein
VIVTVVRCDRCKKLVDAPPPSSNDATCGYYHGWRELMDAGEHDVCDACMWADPRYIHIFGKMGES